MPRPTDAKLPAEAIPKTHLYGEGVSTCTILTNPWPNARAGPIPSPKFLPTLPRRDASARSTPEEKARRLAVLRAVLADSAPEFQARIDAGEQGEQP